MSPVTGQRNQMFDAVIRAFILLLILLGAFLWIGSSITKMTGGEKQVSVGKAEVTPEFGETVYWGRGRCFTCHSMGDRGSAVRGPNHGAFGEKFPLPMGTRAVERARARSEKTGVTYTAVDYLVESLADPGAFVVEGYKNEMAVVFAPPISLSLTEIKAVVAYMMAQGGDLDIAAIDTEPGEVTKKFYARISAAAAAGGGDPAQGEEVFKDNCNECHRLKGEGGGVGPDLSDAGTKGLKFISDSVMKPVQEITKGFETYVAVTKDGRKSTGLKTKDDASGIEITKANGEKVAIARADLKEINMDDTLSVMPEDLTEALTVKDFQDLLSFMMLQKGK